MLKINSNRIYSTPLKHSANFGRTAEFNRNEKTQEELKAEKLEQIAKLAAEANKGPSAIRSFTIVSALMVASALTGAAVLGRFFNLLNGMGLLKKITPKISSGLEKLGKRLGSAENVEAKGIKAALKKGAIKTVEFLENTSKVGIEEQLAKLNSKKARKMVAIRRDILKANPDKKFTKQEIKHAVQEAIKTNPKYQDYFKNITHEMNDLKGSNLAKKSTRAGAATVMGTGALKEASRDEDKNGVPDCVEYNHAKKEATQKFTAALLDVALDSISG